MRTDVVIVGGGLAGLSAANFLARRGISVRVLERRSVLGGRAETSDHSGFALNLGGHALYRRAAGMAVLAKLGIAPAGGVPNASAARAFDRGRFFPLPSGPVSLLTSGLLPARAKFEIARVLPRLLRGEALPEPLTVRQWVESRCTTPEAQRLLYALFRISSYSNDPDRQSARAALEQLGCGVRGNVLYLDRGWQSLVDALADGARQAGAVIEAGARVTRVIDGPLVRGVELAGGGRIEARRVLIAASPAEASAMAPASAFLEREKAELIPVRVAVLDLALSSLPDPKQLFALGIDRPLYFSVHSAYADLAPRGGALIHLMRYGEDGEDAEGELEALADRMQPGWRERVVARRFLPRMTVVHSLDVPSRPRPGTRVPDAPGLWIAGDWVGAEGMLADASLASGERAAFEIAEELDAERTQRVERRVAVHA